MALWNYGTMALRYSGTPVLQYSGTHSYRFSIFAQMTHELSDTIVALSTPSGIGALGLIRLSGDRAVEVVDRIFIGRDLMKTESHHACFGKIVDEEENLIDECVVTVFRSPASFTGEDTVEISCHGSAFIISSIIQLITRHAIRLANPGEFTQRAFLHGKMDLAQAEAVGDLIASRSASQHRLAMTQMRGGISNEINELRSKLIEFASLIELENDFGEEDVEFADRSQLLKLVRETIHRINELEHSFEYGRAIKEGVAVAIVGRPNVGKSTLLNALLKEEKAIVSDIPGTTRDLIEDTIQLGGILFRFIDTAGIHDTEDAIETIGIQRSYEQIERANVILWVEEIQEDAHELAERFRKLKLRKDQHAIIVLNKSDEFHTCHAYDVEEALSTLTRRTPTLAISALTKDHLETLKKLLIETTNQSAFADQQIIISNLRHVSALQQTRLSLENVINGFNSGIPSDLIAIDIRHAQHHLGEIAGVISTDDLLESIFSNFCIGK